MGVNNNFVNSTKKLTEGFLLSQSYWGHNKQLLNKLVSPYAIGTKQGFLIFNPSQSAEYFKRCSFFCSRIVFDKGNILFVNFNVDYKKIVVFFGSRSLQPVYVNKWVGGSITNKYLKKPCVIIVSSIPKDNSILKEAMKKLIPVITIEDSDYSLNKTFYSFFGNDNHKDSICYFYGILSESIIKSLLFSHAKSISI